MSNHKPLSLTQHFEAPEDYVGCFGWICGYSADESFLDKAAERFTRATDFQRANEGKISLAVFLDPSKSPISIQNAPGVAHCHHGWFQEKKLSPVAR